MLGPGTLLQQRYQILKLLASGGMSHVYLAQHLRLLKKVAIKELIRVTDTLERQKEFEEQFRREAQLLGGLNHPNLASVSDYFEEHGSPFLVMDYIEGRTLHDVVKIAPRPIAERRVLVWADELLHVLNYLHTRNPPIIVRDLKPDNIMLSSTDRRLRLIDFGIAKALDPKLGTQPIVKGMGTECYAPLEQYGGGTTDARSDLYSLGGTLYYLLSGRDPLPAWRRGSRGETQPPLHTLNTSVTPRTEAVVQHLLELHPKNRPLSAQQVRLELLDAGS